MKLKNITGFGLALAMAFGVGAAAIAVNANQSSKDLKRADAAVSTTWKLAGSMNGWSTTDGTYTMSDADGDGVYKTTLTLTASTNYTFKVVDTTGDNWYGYSNVQSVKPTDSGVFSSWSDGGDKNIGLWSSTSITLDIGVRASDQAIFILPNGSLTTFKTFYLIVNNQSGDDWTGDWSSPRINYWGSGWSCIWNNSPTMTNMSRSYYGGGKTGDLYSITLPGSTTGLLAAKSDLSAQTDDLAISSSVNAANFYYSSGNKLYGFDLTIIANGAYLRGDWTNGWDAAGQIAMTSSSSSGPFTVTGVNLSAGSAVKALYMTDGAESWCQFNSVSSNDDDLYPVIEVDDHMGGYNAGVQSNGTYNLTVTYNSSADKWDYAFVGTANTDLDAAVSFANTFVSTMTAQCPYNYGTGDYNTGKTSATVATAWSGQMSIYGGLSSDVTAYLTDKDSNISAITAFFTSYDYIYGHYATVRTIEGADFLGRTPSIAASYSPVLSWSISNPTNVATIVAIISGISLVTVAGYFFLRKKKEN